MENHQFFEAHLAQTTPFPFALEIERAEGVYLYDKNGKSYMDLISGLSVSNFGHGHPKIKEAIHAQTEKHLHVMVYGEYLQSAQSACAKTLTQLLPESLNTVYFVNSGAEAIEAALKLAKRATGRNKMMAFKGAYHGSTHGAMSVSANEKKKRAYRPLLPNIEFIRFNEMEDLARIDDSCACVLMETVQGDAGIRIPHPEFMKALHQRCKELGVLLILDEIQAGIGRTGRNFAFEHYDIVPDILVLGKALGGGMPIGACVASRELMELFSHGPMLGHITTFGGHPLICAAANAGLEVLRDEISLEHVQKMGCRLHAKLSAHPAVKEVRSLGLFFAVDLESEEAVQHVVMEGLEKGIIGFWFLSCPWSFRIAPPLNMSEAEFEKASEIILSCLDALPPK